MVRRFLATGLLAWGLGVSCAAAAPAEPPAAAPVESPEALARIVAGCRAGQAAAEAVPHTPALPEGVTALAPAAADCLRGKTRVLTLATFADEDSEHQLPDTHDIPGLAAASAAEVERALAFVRHLARGDTAVPLLLFCETPGCTDVAAAARVLQAAGFRHVFVLQGGRQAWLMERLPQDASRQGALRAYRLFLQPLAPAAADSRVAYEQAVQGCRLPGLTVEQIQRLLRASTLPQVDPGGQRAEVMELLRERRRLGPKSDFDTLRAGHRRLVAGYLDCLGGAAPLALQDESLRLDLVNRLVAADEAARQVLVTDVWAFYDKARQNFPEPVFGADEGTRAALELNRLQVEVDVIRRVCKARAADMKDEAGVNPARAECLRRQESRLKEILDEVRREGLVITSTAKWLTMATAQSCNISARKECLPPARLRPYESLARPALVELQARLERDVMLLLCHCG